MKDNKTSIWLRFRRNKPALISLIFLCFCTFIAIFANQIAPDKSKAANFQTIEIQAKKPGYQQTFIRLLKDKNSNTNRNTGSTAESDVTTYIPISKYLLTKDSIIFYRYLDEESSERESIPLNIFPAGTSVEDLVFSRKYYLGTDSYGRDMLSRLLIGMRVSISVGIISAIISILIGTFLGAVAGYFRGLTDTVIMWLINVMWSIPTLLLVFAFTLALGKGYWQIFIAIGFTMWVNVARLVRGQVLALKEQEYILAAKSLGYSNTRIIIRHILPNIMGPIIVIAAANFAAAIMLEAGLSFLGIGIQPPNPSWGLMIKENYNFIITNNAILAILPGIAIMVLVLAVNLVGNGFRDATDVSS